MPRSKKPQPDLQLRPRTAGRLRVLAGAALIVVATCVAYFPSLSGEFILDDDFYLTDNPLIRAADGLYRFWCTSAPIDYYPVSNTTLWVEWRLWGMQPTGYHVTNLVLHIVESGLIWVILRRLAIPGAFLAALLFAVHPVNVESVAWIAQRKDVLAMLFFLLAILSYVQAEVPSPPQPRASPPATALWYWLSLAAFVLAMLSKGSVAILPLLLLGIVAWLRPLTRHDLIRTAPFFLVSAVLVPVNVWFQMRSVNTPIRTADFTERLLGAGSIIWFYLYKALLPVNLMLVYPQWHIQADDWRWWLPLLGAVIATGVLWRYRCGWSRPLLFAWGFFCVSLVPVMGFTDVGFMEHSLVADHYEHIALIGVVALAAAGWSMWQRRARGTARWLSSVVVVVVCGGLAFLTWQQCSLYASALTLYQAALEKNPDSWMVHNNLGRVLSQAGRLPQAVDHYEAALRLNPYFPYAHNNLGTALAGLGRVQEAIAHYEQALLLKPDYPDAHVNLGAVLAGRGQLQEAIRHYQETLQLKPDYPDAHYHLGNALAQLGRLQEALGQYREALRLNPAYPEAHSNLGTVLVQLGQLQEAIGEFRLALRLQPDYAEAHYNLGTVLVQTGPLPEAIAHFQEALRLKPDYPDAQYNLGVALRKRARGEK